MQDRYRMFRRSNGLFYCQDNVSGKQSSLKTTDKATAKQLIAARNQAAATPMMNVALARTYLSSQSPAMMTRTWDDVMHEMEKRYIGSTLERWQKAMRSDPFRLIGSLPLIHTQSEHFLNVLSHPKAGTSTNKWLRILHNLALGLGWILSPVLNRSVWPKFRYKSRRAITREEHERIVVSEWDKEWKLYYEMLWETGGSQTDIANLHRDNIDSVRKILSYQRVKLASREMGDVTIEIGEKLQHIIDQASPVGYLFPKLRSKNETDRACRFRKRYLALGIKGITLHSYRYAWAERACEAGMPEREAMAHLGHSSKAIHRAYARKAKHVTMPVEYYENQMKEKIVHFSPPQNNLGVKCV